MIIWKTHLNHILAEVFYRLKIRMQMEMKQYHRYLTIKRLKKAEQKKMLKFWQEEIIKVKIMNTGRKNLSCSKK